VAATDIAQLGVSIDSTPFVEATAKANETANAFDRLAASNERLAGSAGSAAGAQAQAASTSASAALTYSTAADRLLANLEKQIALFGASSTAVAHYAGVTAGMTTAELDRYKAQTLVLEGLKEELAAETALAAARDAQLAGQTAFIDSLRVQAETIGLSKTQLLEYKAAQLGVSEQAAPLIASIQAQTAALASSTTAATALGESEAAATARIAAMVEASLTQTATVNDTTVANQRYAASVDELAAAATAAERAGLSFNTVTTQTTVELNAAATATERATVADNEYNAAVARTTAALERRLFAVKATAAELAAYDADLAGATAEESAYQASLVRSIEAQTAEAKAAKAAAAALVEETTAANGASFATSTVTREVVTLGREIGRGDISRFAGSASLLAQNLGLLDKLFTPLGLTIAGVGVAIGVSADAALKADKNLGDYGANVTKIAQQTGASAGFIQQFNFAVESIGGKANEGGAALDHLAQQIGKAEGGSRQAQAAFAAVGISVDDLKRLNFDEVVGKIADAFSNSTDGATKFRTAQLLLGTSSKELIDLFDQGSTGLDAFADHARKLGIVLSEDTIQKLDDLHKANAQAKTDWDAMVTVAETALIPTLLTLAKALHDNAAEADAVKGFFLGVNEVVKGTAVVATAATGLNQFSEFVVAAVTATAEVIKGNPLVAKNEIIDAYQHAKDEGKKYIEFVKDLYKQTAPPADFKIVPTTPLPAPEVGKPKVDRIPGLLEQQDIKTLQDQLSEINSLYAAAVKATQDDYRTANKSTAEYVSTEQALNDKHLKDVQNNIAEQIKVLRAGLAADSPEKRIADQEKINSLQVAATKAVTDYLTTYESLATTETTATQKREAATKLFNDRLQEQLQTQKEAADLQVQALGTGTRENALLVQLNNIDKAYEKAILDAERLFKQGPNTDERRKDYETDIANQKRAADESKAVALDTYDRITVAREDWLAGSEKAWVDWADSATNVNAEIGSTVTTTFNGLTDSLTTFVTTGKLSFTSLADSIIKDLVRIGVQLAEEKAVSALLGAIGGIGGGIGSAAGTAVTAGSTAASFGQSLSGIGSSGVATSFSGSALGYATGGFISGPGSGTSDSIPARLSNGEFVVNAAATRQNRGLLEALNGGAGSSGQRHFANGGFVGATPQSVSGGSTSIVFNIDMSNKGTANAPQQPSASLRSNTDAFQKELESAVLQVVRKHSEPGGQINKIIKQVSR
jgi:lambda family phage tail tape measure protein